jgi:hypothetical protein
MDVGIRKKKRKKKKGGKKKGHNLPLLEILEKRRWKEEKEH